MHEKRLRCSAYKFRRPAALVSCGGAPELFIFIAAVFFVVFGAQGGYILAVLLICKLCNFLFFTGHKIITSAFFIVSDYGRSGGFLFGGAQIFAAYLRVY